METKHTKGEWTFKTTHHKIEIFSFVNGIAETDILNSCLMNGEDISTSEQIANAKLIAAAPDNFEDNVEWMQIHKELLKHNIKIPKSLSDRIMNQALKSKETIKKATE